MPSSTPAGIFTVRLRRARTRPSPPHLAHGCGDDRAVALAGRARAGRDDLAEEGALDRLDLAPAAAGVAGASGGCRPPCRRRCRSGRRTAVSTLIGASTPNAVSCRSSSSRRIASAPGRVRGRGPRDGRAAEERVHDVLEADERAGRRRRPPPPPGRQRVAAEVDDLPLLRVGEDLVGGVDLLELLLRRRVRVDVRVELARQLR